MQSTRPNHDAAPSASSELSADREKLPGIKHIIAVASGKGGVGKSTVSVNLALALQQAGYRVGLLDADILGPSVPVMLGLPTGEKPETTADQKIIPAQRFGLKAISMGMLTGDDNPPILRGPMVGKYLKMFIGSVQWGRLDYLILDFPPGTGDTQLTLAQSIPLSGAIVVTTPQDVSLKIARRGLRAFETLNVAILGIIENMSGFTCPHCQEHTDIFRRGGGERMSIELGVQFLGAIPLDADIVTGGDEGRPIVANKPSSVAAKAYVAIATELIRRLEELPTTVLGAFVWNWETNDGEPAWMDRSVRPMGSATTPVGFRRRDPRTLSVLWEDGRSDDFDVRDLRLACPCALCVEEMSGRALLDPKSVALDVTPQGITSAGNYAIVFRWNDGHSTGIYSLKHLRALAERFAAKVVEDV